MAFSIARRLGATRYTPYWYNLACDDMVWKFEESIDLLFKLSCMISEVVILGIIPGMHCSIDT